MTEESTIQRKRYLLNVDLWRTKGGAISLSLDDVLAHIRSELECLDVSEEIAFCVQVKSMSDAEVEALPEWDGP